MKEDFILGYSKVLNNHAGDWTRRTGAANLRNGLGGIFNSGKRGGFAAAEFGAWAVGARVSVHRHGFGGAGGGGAGVGADAQLSGTAAICA